MHFKHRIQSKSCGSPNLRMSVSSRVRSVGAGLEFSLFSEVDFHYRPPQPRNLMRAAFATRPLTFYRRRPELLFPFIRLGRANREISEIGKSTRDRTRRTLISPACTKSNNVRVLMPKSLAVSLRLSSCSCISPPSRAMPRLTKVCSIYTCNSQGPVEGFSDFFRAAWSRAPKPLVPPRCTPPARTTRFLPPRGYGGCGLAHPPASSPLPDVLRRRRRWHTRGTARPSIPPIRRFNAPPVGVQLGNESSHS